MFFRRGAVTPHPERYLIRSETSIPRFLEDGLYFRHLSRFVDFFPREQISIILYDDIKSRPDRSEEHTSELQSLMRISYAVFCLKKKKNRDNTNNNIEKTKQQVNILLT